VAGSIVAGQAGYNATTANGVTTRNRGSWGGPSCFADASSVPCGQVATVAPSVPPSFRRPNTSIALGPRLVLPIQIDGVGPFSYQWYLNGVLIAGATSNPYVIDTVTAAASGTYTVRVANAAGANTFSVGSVAINGAGAP